MKKIFNQHLDNTFSLIPLQHTQKNIFHTHIYVHSDFKPTMDVI